jgi:predicted Zn-dependent peptidase
MYEVIEDLKDNPLPEEELQKVKNQLRVQKIRFMDIMSGIGILFYLGQNAAMGDWTEANNNPKMCDQVTADDVQRVANEYFANDQRNVMIINSKAGPEGEAGGGEDPRFVQTMRQRTSPGWSR